MKHEKKCSCSCIFHEHSAVKSSDTSRHINTDGEMRGEVYQYETLKFTMQRHKAMLVSDVQLLAARGETEFTSIPSRS